MYNPFLAVLNSETNINRLVELAEMMVDISSLKLIMSAQNDFNGDNHYNFLVSETVTRMIFDRVNYLTYLVDGKDKGQQMDQ